MKPRKAPGERYAWLIAGLAFLVLLTAAGIRSTPGVLMRPIQSELGWSAATVSLAVAINIAFFGLMGPFAAALMQSIGVRRTLLLGLGLLALATTATSFVRTPLELVLSWGVAVGLGVGMIGLVVAPTIATRWFVRGRGTVVGLLTAANATGQLVFLPAFAALAQHFGWRPLGFILAAVALLVAVPVAIFMRDRPESLGLRAYGAAPGDPPGDPPLLRNANPLGAAFGVLGRASRKLDFWFLFGTFFICGASTNGFIGTHFIAACGDHGIPEVRAASYLAMMGVFDLIGTTASGWLSDRWDSRKLLFAYYGLRGLSLLFVPFAFGIAGLAGLPLFAIFYGLDWVATIPPTVRLTIDAFGKDEGPIVFGWVLTGHQMGAAAIALVAGVIRTDAGSYDPAFTLSALLCFCAAVAVFGIGAQRRTRQAAVAQ